MSLSSQLPWSQSWLPRKNWKSPGIGVWGGLALLLLEIDPYAKLSRLSCSIYAFKELNTRMHGGVGQEIMSQMDHGHVHAFLSHIWEAGPENINSSLNHHVFLSLRASLVCGKFCKNDMDPSEGAWFCPIRMALNTQQEYHGDRVVYHILHTSGCANRNTKSVHLVKIIQSLFFLVCNEYFCTLCPGDVVTMHGRETLRAPHF